MICVCFELCSFGYYMLDIIGFIIIVLYSLVPVCLCALQVFGPRVQVICIGI